MKKSQKEKLERIVEITPAYDMRDKGYGVHGCDLRMVLKGKLGAVQFVLFTGWYLDKTLKYWEGTHERQGLTKRQWRNLSKPLPADLGYHSPKPHYKGQKVQEKKCCYLDGHKCYYDGSGLNAHRIFNILREKGHEGVWKELEKYYKQVFQNK